MTDFQQQMEHEQEQHERIYPPPFSDEWYARMEAAHGELNKLMKDKNREGWKCLIQES